MSVKSKIRKAFTQLSDVVRKPINVRVKETPVSETLKGRHIAVYADSDRCRTVIIDKLTDCGAEITSIAMKAGQSELPPQGIHGMLCYVDFATGNEKSDDNTVYPQVKDIYFTVQRNLRYLTDTKNGGSVVLVGLFNGSDKADTRRVLSEGALAGFAKGLAKKLLPGHIRVNYISVLVDSDNSESETEKYMAKAGSLSALLLSDASVCVTGQCFNIRATRDMCGNTTENGGAE